MDAVNDLLPSGDMPTAAADRAVLDGGDKVPLVPAAQAAMLAPLALSAEETASTEPAAARKVIRPSQLPKYLTNDTGEPVTVYDGEGHEHVINPGEVMRDAIGRPVPIPDMAKYLREKGIPNPLIKFRVTPRKGAMVAQPVEVDAVDESDAVRQAVNALGIKHTNDWTWLVFVLEK